MCALCSHARPERPRHGPPLRRSHRRPWPRRFHGGRVPLLQQRWALERSVPTELGMAPVYAATELATADAVSGMRCARAWGYIDQMGERGGLETPQIKLMDGSSE